LRLPDNATGQTIRCPKCKQQFTVGAPQQTVTPEPPPPATPPPPAQPQWEPAPERPVRKRRRREEYDDDDDEPRRRETRIYIEHEKPRSDAPGVISLIFGVLGMVCLFIGCCIGPVYGVAIGFSIIGLPLGFLARGNLRVAGILLNLLVLLPAIILLVLFLTIGGLAMLGSQTAPPAATSTEPTATMTAPANPTIQTKQRDTKSKVEGIRPDSDKKKGDDEAAGQANKKAADKAADEANEREIAKRLAAERRAREEKAANAKKQKDEQDAAGLLDIAKTFIKAKMLEKAEERLKKIVSQYPDTQAAKEAAELLNKLYQS
jgi:hypothetical protein